MPIGNFLAEIANVANTWEISSIILQIATGSNVGNRFIVCQITPNAPGKTLQVPLVFGVDVLPADSNMIAIGGPGFALQRITFVPSVGTAYDTISFPTPAPLYMDTGYKVEIFDINGVDNSDAVQMTIIYREVTEWR